MRTLPRTTRLEALAGLALAAALAGCTRDLDLPDTSGPALGAVTPGAAYAGEVIEISGSGFASNPIANLVQFGAGTARGEAFSAAGGLLLHVPADAGDGPITVATSRGTSAPSGNFDYLGLGELRNRVASYEIPLLHKPYRVIASGGETFIDSDLVVGVLRYDRPDFVAPYAQSSIGLPWADALAWYEEAPPPFGTRLVRYAVASEQLSAVSVAGGQSVHLAALRTPPGDRIAIVRRSRAAGNGLPALPSTITLHDAATLATAVGTFTVQMPLPHGCDDAGDGRLACVFHDAFGAPGKLAVITPGQLVNTAAFTPPQPLQHNDFDLEEDDPLCVATAVGGHRVAVMGQADGGLLLADLDAGATPTFTSISTGSSTPAQSLACTGSTVIVAKTADDLLLSIELSGAVNWAVEVPRAARAAIEDGVVHVAGDANNVVELRNLAGGTLRARRTFDSKPGRNDGFGVQAITWTDTGFWDVPALLLVGGYPYGLMEVPLQATNGGSRVYPIYLDVGDAIGIIPGIQGGYLALREQGLGNFDLGRFVQLGVDGPNDYYAATNDGLVTVLGSAGNAQQLSAISGPLFRNLGLHPAGGVWGAVNRFAAGEYTVRRWSEAAAAAGAPATATWTAPGPLDGAGVLLGSLWAFYWDGEQDHAVELSDAMTQLQDVPLGDYLNQVLAVSPNGRTFVSWESQPFSENTSIVVWSADDVDALPRAATIPLDGQVTGAAFDPSGEKLYVTLQNPGRIVVLE